MRWTLALPITGVLLFALVTYGSVRFNREQHWSTGKYFWWSSIRLDSEPGYNRPSPEDKCKPGPAGEPCWEPQSMWVDPGWLARILIISALPAFLIARPIVDAFARFGINEVITFMISMPVLIFAWYYFVAWVFSRLLSRWRRPTPVEQ